MGARRSGRTSALAAAVVAIAVLLPAAPAAAAVIEEPAGRLTRVEVTPDLNCAVNHIDDTAGEFYSGTACGTFVATGGTLFGPANVPAGSAASPRTTFTAVSQSAVMGSGTSADPYRIETVVDLSGTTLRVTEVDTYVRGEESYRTDVRIDNTGNAGATGILYRAGDCFLQNSDRGFGRLGPAGAVACVASDATGNAPGERIEQWLPLTAGSRAYHANYSEVWARIGAQQPFDDTCRCGENIDNGAGLSWEWSVPPSGSATFSHITTFSPLGRVPLQASKAAAQTPVEPGAEDSYTIAIANPNAEDVTVTSITDTLPAGFAYRPGTTSVATTDDPEVEGSTLTWTGPFTVPPNGTLELSFGVTVADEPGTYLNEASATATDYTVTPTGPTAPVQVIAGDPDVPRVPGDDVQRVAINLCQFLFTEPDQARTVVLARSDVFADALAGAPLAADDSCILYTTGGPTAPLDAETRAEIDRVLPDGGRVRIMGGTQAVSTTAEQELTAAGYVLERFAGPTRYETAEVIARRVVEERPGTTEAMLAFGGNFPDAVTGGAYGAEAGVPILLTPTDALHPAAARAFADLGTTTTAVLGGAAVISDAAANAAPNPVRVAGPNRMATAVAVATTLWSRVLPGPPDDVVVTNVEREDGWALTLASAPLSARNDAPQVGAGIDRYPSETEAYLEGLTPRATAAFVIGSAAYVSDATAASISEDVGTDASS